MRLWKCKHFGDRSARTLKEGENLGLGGQLRDAVDETHLLEKSAKARTGAHKKICRELAQKRAGDVKPHQLFSAIP
jgi:hypothetical protein